MRPRVDSTVAAIVLGSGDGGQLSCELSVFWRQELPAEGRLFRFRSGRWCGDLPRSGKTFSSAMPSGLQFFLLLFWSPGLQLLLLGHDHQHKCQPKAFLGLYPTRCVSSCPTSGVFEIHQFLNQ